MKSPKATPAAMRALRGFLLLSLLVAPSVGQTQRGGACKMKNGLTGTCKQLSSCQAALDAKRRGMQPERCGFETATALVCCENPASTTPAPPAEDLTSKSAQMCREYGKAIYETTLVPSLLPDEEPVEMKVDRCGHKVVGLIVGGTVTEPKEFPHMVALGYYYEDAISWECGGSLISVLYVLTAGHCMRSREKGPVRYARVGDLNLRSTDDDARQETIEIEAIFSHPNYTTASQYNDIALLRLNKSVTLSAYVIPICLGQKTTALGKKAIAIGWGATAPDSAGSEELRKVTIDFFNETSCRSTFPANRRLSHGIDYATQLCAGSATEKRDTCQGDSGGPLLIYNRHVYCMYTLIGVTSFGRSCGAIGSPGVYTRVATYVPWIEKIVWPSEENDN